MASNYELQMREPHIDSPRTPKLQCQECGRYHESVDPFILLCYDCEQKFEKLGDSAPIKRSLMFY